LVVIFDFDGVLADTERLHFRAAQQALAAHGLALDERAYFERYLGYGDRDLILTFARDLGRPIDDDTVERFLAAKSRRYRAALESGDALFVTAAPCIARLGARFSLAIASGSLHAEIAHILGIAGLLDAFDAIVGADDVVNGKPAPDSYLEAAARLNTFPRNAVAIEDSRWGLEAARAAGMRTIGVTTTYPADALTLADVVVGSLDEITTELIDALP
jgi:beta-phosphoglucomutase